MLFSRILIPGLFCFCCAVGFSQDLTYQQHIRPIIQNHCVRCHRPGSVAPFSLETYEDLAPKAGFASYLVEIGYMPPWKADTAFRHFKNENVLSAEEIGMIRKWAESGMKRDSSALPPYEDVHRYQLHSDIAEDEGIRTSFSMRKGFVLNPSGKEEFRFFHIPGWIGKPAYIKGIRFLPGNRKMVHHSRVMLDTSGTTSGIDGMSETDSGIYKFQRKPLADPFLFGWVPGNDEIIFPPGTGKKLLPGTDILLNMHYAPTPIATTDSSTVMLYVSEQRISREISTLTLTESQITNQPFFLPAQTKPKFYMRSARLTEDISLISIMPHMHLLGVGFRSYAITGTGEIIPLINIPSWDTNWQMTYLFQRYVHLPKGSIIFAEATYDNTIDNPRNPFMPPRNVTYGWGINNEMMNLVIYYVRYQQGDENISL